MKNAKKRKLDPRIPVLCLMLALLAVLIGVLIVLESREMPEPAEDSTLPSQLAPTEIPTENVAETEAATDDVTQAPTELVPETEPAQNSDMIELETPYCSLYFPGMWEDLLHINPVEENSYRMEFSCRFESGEIYRVFDICFDDADGILLGSVSGYQGDRVSVSVRFYEPDESLRGDELESFLAMQEDANQLIALLPLEESGSHTQTGENILIQTPFCQLAYPCQWENYLHVEHSGGKEYSVDFFARFDGEEGIYLFSVQFSADTENAILVLKDSEGMSTGVSIQMGEIETDGLTQDELEIVYSMQDALNDLLDALSENAYE